MTTKFSCLIVGGTPRVTLHEQLKRKLQYERLDWEPASRMSTVKALCGRIERGEYDVVVVLIHLCSHRTAYDVRMASKRSGVPYTTLNVGYGPESIRAAVEAVFLLGSDKEPCSSASC